MKTGMGGDHATQEPVDSARGIIRRVEQLRAKENGRFVTWQRRPAPGNAPHPRPGTESVVPRCQRSAVLFASSGLGKEGGFYCGAAGDAAARRVRLYPGKGPH